MGYVLFLTIIVWAGYGPQIATSAAEFPSAGECNEAGRMVGDDLKKSKQIGPNVHVFFQCAPKGARP